MFVQQKFLFPAVKTVLERGGGGGVQRIKDCCSFCDLHKEILHADLLVCGKRICHRIMLEKGPKFILNKIGEIMTGIEGIGKLAEFM